jgi:hypothetical protein
MGLGLCIERKTAPSDRVGGAEDRIVDPHVVAEVGHVVAFALAVGVVLHAVERQVVQAHLIVAIAHQHLGNGPRHELGDGGRGRQLRGYRGGQQGQGAGGEGVAQDLALGVGVGGERWAPAAREWPARRAGPTRGAGGRG